MILDIKTRQGERLGEIELPTWALFQLEILSARFGGATVDLDIPGQEDALEVLVDTPANGEQFLRVRPDDDIPADQWLPLLRDAIMALEMPHNPEVAP